MARTEWDDDDDENDGSQFNDVPELRKAYRALQRENKALKTENATVKGAVRTRSLKDVLADKELNPAIAEFVPADLTTEDEISAWVESKGAVFAAALPAPPAGDDEKPPAEAGPDLSALQRINSQQQSGSPFTGDAAQFEALIKAADSPEALNQLLFGNKDGRPLVAPVPI